MLKKSHTIAYYISAHGYGHGVRSCDIIRSLNDLYPDVHVTIVSDLSAAFFENRLGRGPYAVRNAAFDLGMVQLDSIRVDVAESLRRLLLLYERRKELVALEADYLAGQGVGLVVVDIPGIPLESAALLGIPRIAVANFSWDWIYSAFVSHDHRWEPIVEAFREAYSRSDLLLRLPFSPEMSVFPQKEDLPLVASPGADRRPEVALLTGADPDKKWLLLSFTALEWDEEALRNIEKLSRYEFFTVLPLEWRRGNIHPIDREQVRFADVVASMDGVITKPGFGILSDCLINAKPLIYADRSDFLEYAVLETAIQRYFRHVHIPVEKLYRGEVGDAIKSLWRRPPPVMTLAGGGAALAARRMCGFL
jgi:L-arabinokinase